MNKRMQGARALEMWTMWALMTSVMACKTGEPVTQEPMTPEEPAQTTEVKPEGQPAEVGTQVTIIDKVEQVPPEQRTFKDDMVIVCYAPSRVDAQVKGDERVKQMTEYISNNIYTPEAVRFFQDMSVLGVSERDAFFEKQVNDLGLTSCPFLEESRHKEETLIEPGSEGVNLGDDVDEEVDTAEVE